MSMESQGTSRSKESSAVTPDRSKTVAEVFERYDEKLMRWGKIQLKEKGLSDNIHSDTQDIVAMVYQDLLTNEKSIDLTRSEKDIKQFLNVALDHAIKHNITNMTAKKRILTGKLISLDEITENEEGEIPAELEKYFVDPSDLSRELRGRIKQALSTLKSLDRKKADIIIKRYFEGKSVDEIAAQYGESRQSIYNHTVRALEILKGILNSETR